MRCVHGIVCLLVGATIAAAVGCGTSAVTPASGSASNSSSVQWLLADEPAGAVLVSEAKETLVSGTGDIVIVGRISAGDHEPWDEGRAAFLLSDPFTMLDDSHADHDQPGHDPDKCPFCNRAKSQGATLAMVSFHGENGQVIPTDARQLLGVEQDQIVVVRGQGQLDPQGNLAVVADGLYIRR